MCIDNRRISNFTRDIERREEQGRDSGGGGGEDREIGEHLETLIWRMVVLGMSKT